MGSKVNWRNILVMIVVSFLAFPISYIFNNTVEILHKGIIVVIATCILAAIVLILKLLTKDVKDWTYYGEYIHQH